MSLIKPFRALHYNPKKIKAFARVVCPPYDVMSKKDIRRFKKTSPYNFSNILIADTPKDYAKLAQKFNSWINRGILIEDETPCFYLYEQTFIHEGKTHTRIGFLGLLRLDKQGIVLPHEYTFGAPKKDRYHIIREMKANISPIFTLLPKRLPILGETYTWCKRRKPLARFRDFLNIRNRVWRIDDPGVVRAITASFKNRKLFIADGHHRFEVAYRYFRSMKGKYKELNYILTYFTDPDSGILILPTHRVAPVAVSLRQALRRLSVYFSVQEVDRKRVSKALMSGEKLFFSLYTKKKYYLLHLKNPHNLYRMFKGVKEQSFKDLHIHLLHKIVFPLLKVAKDIQYTHSFDEAQEMAVNNKMAFFMPAPAFESVFTIARRGYKLPQKSTYFYPKILSGIVVRKFKR